MPIVEFLLSVNLEPECKVEILKSADIMPGASLLYSILIPRPLSATILNPLKSRSIKILSAVFWHSSIELSIIYRRRLFIDYASVPPKYIQILWRTESVNFNNLMSSAFSKFLKSSDIIF